jgi:hypothetical protein
LPHEGELEGHAHRKDRPVGFRESRVARGESGCTLLQRDFGAGELLAQLHDLHALAEQLLLQTDAIGVQPKGCRGGCRQKSDQQQKAQNEKDLARPAAGRRRSRFSFVEIRGFDE